MVAGRVENEPVRRSRQHGVLGMPDELLRVVPDALVVEDDTNPPRQRRDLDASDLLRSVGSRGVVVCADIQASVGEQQLDEVVSHLRSFRSALFGTGSGPPRAVLTA